jgi:predicted lysophospholipase L1 biosynthesis ABC-type transport system permease subunit
MASWIDSLREWNYDIGPVFSWLMDTVDYQAARHGPIAYGVAILIVILLALSFPPTRGLTKTVCSAVFKNVMTYIQLVASLVTVQLLGFTAKLFLTLFHKARIWLTETYRRARE